MAKRGPWLLVLVVGFAGCQAGLPSSGDETDDPSATRRTQDGGSELPASGEHTSTGSTGAGTTSPEMDDGNEPAPSSSTSEGTDSENGSHGEGESDPGSPASEGSGPGTAPTPSAAPTGPANGTANPPGSETDAGAVDPTNLDAAVPGPGPSVAPSGTAPEPTAPEPSVLPDPTQPGPAGSEPTVPPDPSTPTTPTEPTTAPDPTPTEPTTAPDPTPSVPPDPEPPPSSGMLPIRASELAETLSASGFDPLDLPQLLDDADQIAHVPLMQSFDAALGTGCGTCHQGDHATWTPNKFVTKHMWEDILGKLAMADGSPLYCDSCHQGNVRFLDRSDPEALEAWMQQNMVDKLVRRDGQPHDCSTCHGTPANYELIETWSQ